MTLLDPVPAAAPVPDPTADGADIPWHAALPAAIGRWDWVSVCPVDWIVPGSGVSALVGDRQVAVFRLGDDRLLALDNLDPFSGAQVLARGIVGDHDGEPMVASPMYKHPFSLVSGVCLTEPDVRVAAYPVRDVLGIVHVGRPLAR